LLLFASDEFPPAAVQDALGNIAKAIAGRVVNSARHRVGSSREACGSPFNLGPRGFRASGPAEIRAVLIEKATATGTSAAAALAFRGIVSYDFRHWTLPWLLAFIWTDSAPRPRASGLCFGGYR
jgi:hypothetical protein